MRKVLLFGLAATLLVAAPALAQEGPGKFFEEGKALFAQEKYEAAFKAFDVVTREWPDDAEFTPRAMVMGGECLLRMGHLEDAVHRLEKARERCREMPDLAEHAEKLLQKARAMREERRAGEGKGAGEPKPRDPREDPRPREGPRPKEKIAHRMEQLERELAEKGVPPEEAERILREERARMELELRPPANPEEMMARLLAELERKLREKGLTGEELEHALAAEKARMKEKAPPPGNPEEKLRRMVELWREQGVAQEEIDARIHRFQEEQRMFERARAEFEEARRRMEEEGVPPEEVKRRLGEMERKRKEESERGWREGREGDLEQARRQFLQLAERLGIPPAEAERFLAEQARRRPAWVEGERRPEGRSPRAGGDQEGPRPEGRPGTPDGERGGDRLRQLEERLERLEQAVRELLERLDRR
jgi:tetratricopeptide (TPR) repeat protein